MKKSILIALIVLALNQTFCSVKQLSPVSSSALESNYRQGIKNASKNETVISGGSGMRRADDRSWEKRWNEMRARKRSERRAERRAVEEKRRELLATGKYYDDGRGNIRLKREFRYEQNIIAQPVEENSSATSVILGFVTRVKDGDTIQIKDRVVRLRGIDAPETDQPFGMDAALHLNSLVCGKPVRVEYSETDQYGRIVGTVYCQMEDINLTMIRDGFAWHYKQYDNTQSYADAEDEARMSRRGLWISNMPIPPWEHRSMK